MTTTRKALRGTQSNARRYSDEGTTETAAQRAATEIRGLMAAQRKTAIDLASVIGVSPATAARCVAGARPLDINQLEATAQWLEVSIDRIISPAQGLAYSK